MNRVYGCAEPLHDIAFVVRGPVEVGPLEAKLATQASLQCKEIYKSGARVVRLPGQVVVPIAPRVPYVPPHRRRAMYAAHRQELQERMIVEGRKISKPHMVSVFRSLREQGPVRSL